MSIISLEDINKVYHTTNKKKETNKQNIKLGCFNVNINVEKGDIYGFLGPNGAGKTTIIRQMIGFIKSNSGKGTILGHDIWKNSNLIMKDTGYLAGEVMLPNYMTGYSYLKTIAAIRGNVDWNYVQQLIDKFQIITNIKIKKMSKGMKQKIAIIAAFMHKPQICILDEPTSGLDPLMQNEFKKLVQDSQANGATIFISSHIFDEIDTLCNKVTIIKRGKIICELNVAKIQNQEYQFVELQFKQEQDYEHFLEQEQEQKWTIIACNKAVKTSKIIVDKMQLPQFLQVIENYEVEKSVKDFNLKAHFLDFYGDEERSHV